MEAQKKLAAILEERQRESVRRLLKEIGATPEEGIAALKAQAKELRQFAERPAAAGLRRAITREIARVEEMIRAIEKSAS